VLSPNVHLAISKAKPISGYRFSKRRNIGLHLTLFPLSSRNNVKLIWVLFQVQPKQNLVGHVILIPSLEITTYSCQSESVENFRQWGCEIRLITVRD